MLFRSGHAAVLISRLIPTVRSLISVPAGLARMPIGRFVVYTGVGSALWSTFLIGLGWFLGENWMLIGRYLVYLEYPLLIALAVVVVVFFWRRRGGRRDDVV